MNCAPVHLDRVNAAGSREQHVALAVAHVAERVVAVANVAPEQRVPLAVADHRAVLLVGLEVLVFLSVWTLDRGFLPCKQGWELLGVHGVDGILVKS